MARNDPFVAEGKLAPAAYRIVIQGKIRVDWSDWLSGMVISIEDDRGCPVTVLSGSVADQAVLRGILCKIWDLNLTILSVSRVEMNAKDQT